MKSTLLEFYLLDFIYSILVTLAYKTLKLFFVVVYCNMFGGKKECVFDLVQKAKAIIVLCKFRLTIHTLIIQIPIEFIST